jgi:hypothetical protein
MIEKKLITLACVLGILACGACFGPIHTAPPPPPPILDSNGIRSVNVTVVNASASRRVDPDQLGGAIANNINQRSRGNGVTAQTQRQTGKGSAVLEVIIESESATPRPPVSSAGTELWTFDFKVSATLTTDDGRLIWKEKADYSFTNWLPQEDPEAAWLEPRVRIRAPQFLATWLVMRMFTGEQSR